MKEPPYSQKTSFKKLRILKCAALAASVFFTFSEAVYAADVTLQWDADADPNVMGYRLYYDTDSGDPYQGYGATHGSSPIGINPAYDDQNPDPNVVEFTIHGLSEGTYYFAVTALNYSSNPPLESGYSNEVSTVLSTDTAPPYTVNHDPVPGATGVSVDTLITLEIRDEGVGVDLSTISVWVNGSRVDPSVSGDSAAYILSYDPTEDFAYEQSVSVEVEASDLQGNTMAPDFYSFTTESDPFEEYSTEPLSVSSDKNTGSGGGGGGCFISTLGQG